MAEISVKECSDVSPGDFQPTRAVNRTEQAKEAQRREHERVISEVHMRCSFDGEQVSLTTRSVLRDGSHVMYRLRIGAIVVDL